jgi:hypothetical protein
MDFEEEMQLPTIQTYEDILAYYKDLLTGKLTDSPGGPLDEETIDILPYLLKINSYGVVSVCSQPGLDDEVTKQRAFITFYITSELYNNIKSKLDSLVLLDFSIHAYKYEDLSEEFGGDCIVVTLEDNEEVTHIYPQYKLEDLDILTSASPPEEAEAVLKDLYQIHIIDETWGRKDLIFTEFISLFS